MSSQRTSLIIPNLPELTITRSGINYRNKDSSCSPKNTKSSTTLNTGNKSSLNTSSQSTKLATPNINNSKISQSTSTEKLAYSGDNNSSIPPKARNSKIGLSSKQDQASRGNSSTSNDAYLR